MEYVSYFVGLAIVEDLGLTALSFSLVCRTAFDPSNAKLFFGNYVLSKIYLTLMRYTNSPRGYKT